MYPFIQRERWRIQFLKLLFASSRVVESKIVPTLYSPSYDAVDPAEVAADLSRRYDCDVKIEEALPLSKMMRECMSVIATNNNSWRK